MFCTDCREILKVVAISLPVLPDSTSFFTSIRVASVIFARRRLLGSFAAVAAVLTTAGFRPRRLPVALCTAATKAFALSNPYFAGKPASLAIQIRGDYLFKFCNFGASSHQRLKFFGEHKGKAVMGGRSGVAENFLESKFRLHGTCPD